MESPQQLRLGEIEQRVCDLAVEHMAIPRRQISPSSRLIEDLHCDSLDLMEFVMALEQAFGVTFPDNSSSEPICKSIFTRQPFRLSDLAEIVYVQQGTGTPQRNRRKGKTHKTIIPMVPFSQLDGRWRPSGEQPFEPMNANGPVRQFRRRSDGMRCVLIPEAAVEIGSDVPDGLPDERPPHIVEVDSFVIDAEPVSTTAYCRFLNSIATVSSETLSDWFALDPKDDRNQHAVITKSGNEWRPTLGAERWPMVLVSWFGANAYSLWANGRDWNDYRDEAGVNSFLPTEAQWEYAARGTDRRQFPWGNDPPSPDRMRFGRHDPGDTYTANSLPLAGVNEALGLSPFGLHHMAGNVWQWCRDWYSEDFYQQPAAHRPNPLNRLVSGVRSERGGSWVGPAELCRSSYRRGRSPCARGRCLGFRCVSPPENAR
ncbi:MAG: SUMF1/EgtB/PvdO family nonheme iron enzyme [Planctomycetes bacterium]|nr:SUMF1/EgtB/PvdO family nonheme iron enzyme [Planctomycetota bacterium]